jgi:HEAT repeat protein
MDARAQVTLAEARSREPLTGGYDRAAREHRDDDMQRSVDRVRIMVERMQPPSDGEDSVPTLSVLETRLTSNDPEDVYDAIIDIGKQGHRELADRVAPFLTTGTPFLREAAVRALVFHLRLPAYQADAVRLLTQDPDGGVRAAAAMGLNTFAMRDRELVGKLVDVALDTGEVEEVRDAAFMSALVGAGIDRAEYPKAAWVPGFDGQADWALLARALRRAGIAVPPRLAERAGQR